jgi:hypothetical protein
MMRRRWVLLFGAGAASLAATRSFGQASTRSATLSEAPLRLLGEWGHSSAGDVSAVLTRARRACLSGMRLLSDRQPSRLKVENRRSGNPAIWLHDDEPTTAWIIVNVGAQDWSKLAYQFGHELGHVLANSWDAASKPGNPCQWLEEVLVEAFSLRGLGELASSWEKSPVFPNDAPFGSSIRRYRRNALRKYEELAASQMTDSQPDRWFRQFRPSLEGSGGLSGPGEAAVPIMLRELEEDVRAVEDLGALNRWPGRSTVPIEQYLRLWKKSCDEVGAAGRLPGRVRDLFGLA